MNQSYLIVEDDIAGMNFPLHNTQFFIVEDEVMGFRVNAFKTSSITIVEDDVSGF